MLRRIYQKYWNHLITPLYIFPKTFHENILVNIKVYVHIRVLSPSRPKLFLYFTSKWWNEQLFAATNGKYLDPPLAPKVSIHQSTCYSQRNEFSTSCWFFQPPWSQYHTVFIFLPWIRLSNGKAKKNRFAFFISLFGLSTIFKIRYGEHAHYVGLVVAYTWKREKQMFVALGKEFDILSAFIYINSN